MGRTIWASLRRVGLALAAAALIGVGEGGAVQADAGWTVVPSPGTGQLVGVAASDAADAWAVGSRATATATVTLAEHWDGSAWRVVPTPSPGGAAALLAVTAPSPTDAWAVGSRGATTSAPLIEHWDGRAWRVVPGAAVSGHGGAQLSGVAAVSASDVWAVGGAGSDALIEHWDGTRWRRLASPFHPGPTETLSLGAVTVISSADVWAVGSLFNAANAPSQVPTAHWDGRSWKAVPSALIGGRFNFLDGVSASGPADVLAVGWSIAPPRGGPGGFAEHWDGRGWSEVLLPPTPVLSEGEPLSGVASLSPSDAWAVGYLSCGFRRTRSCGTLLLHWDGSAWSSIPSPEPAGDNGLLGAVSLPGGTVWAVGWAATATGRAPLTMRTLTG